MSSGGDAIVWACSRVFLARSARQAGNPRSRLTVYRTSDVTRALDVTLRAVRACCVTPLHHDGAGSAWPRIRAPGTPDYPPRRRRPEPPGSWHTGSGVVGCATRAVTTPGRGGGGVFLERDCGASRLAEPASQRQRASSRASRVRRLTASRRVPPVRGADWQDRQWPGARVTGLRNWSSEGIPHPRHARASRPTTARQTQLGATSTAAPRDFRRSTTSV